MKSKSKDEGYGGRLAPARKANPIEIKTWHTETEIVVGFSEKIENLLLKEDQAESLIVAISKAREELIAFKSERQ